jgi:hypothetical protein
MLNLLMKKFFHGGLAVGMRVANMVLHKTITHTAWKDTA